MKKCLSLCIMTLLFVACEQEGIKPNKVQKDPKIVVEPDQTDIFAIPLDEDAEDQQEELYQLEHPNK